jgi:hypothetical protein
VPEGFEESAGVTVKKGTAAAELPGAVAFDMRPNAPKAGEKYTVACEMVNQGSQPIGIKDVIVTSIVNGRRASSPLTPLTTAVAPGQRGKLFETSDFWKEEITTWSLEVTVRTTRGETYKNSLVWK